MNRADQSKADKRASIFVALRVDQAQTMIRALIEYQRWVRLLPMDLGEEGILEELDRAGKLQTLLTALFTDRMEWGEMGQGDLVRAFEAQVASDEPGNA